MIAYALIGAAGAQFVVAILAGVVTAILAGVAAFGTGVVTAAQLFMVAERMAALGLISSSVTKSPFSTAQ